MFIGWNPGLWKNIVKNIWIPHHVTRYLNTCFSMQIIPQFIWKYIDWYNFKSGLLRYTIYPAVKCDMIYKIVNCIYENVKLLFLATSLLTVIEWYSDMVIINLKKLHDVKRAASSTLLTCTTIRIQRGYCSTHNTTLWILHIIIMWENETRHCLNAFDFAKHLPLYKIYQDHSKKVTARGSIYELGRKEVLLKRYFYISSYSFFL